MKLFTLLAALVGTATAARNGYGYMDDWECTLPGCFVPYLKSVVTTGLNNVVLGFAMPRGVTETSGWYWDSAGAFYGLTEAQRTDVHAHYASHNAHLWMSLGGGTYTIDYLNENPEVVSTLACTRAKNQGYYGVDFDLEFVDQGNWNAFYPWAIAASQACAGIIGHIAHAPQVPYLGTWLNYGYEKLIPYVEHFLVQYYNQGPSRPYNSEAGVWAASTDNSKETWTDIVQRDSRYRDLVVIGKYMRTKDGGSGIVTASEFNALLKIGEENYGYNNGYMIWKIPMASDAADLTAFINTHIPLLANGGGSIPETTSTTKRPITVPPPATTRYVPPPPVTSSSSTTTSYVPPPPVTTPHVPPLVTSTSSTSTTSPSTGGDKVAYCQAHVGHPIPDWSQNCKDLCAYYGGAPAFCPGATTGETLLACVLQRHSDSCQRV